MLDETSFNISTADYITSHRCSGAPDLTWGNQGSYSCNRSAYPKATFTRHSLWIQPATEEGLLFGKVLCPHVKLAKGVRTEVPVGQLSTLCASTTFNNCAQYYDALGGNASVLQRSKEPSCDPRASPVADGPKLDCVAQNNCVSPCGA